MNATRNSERAGSHPPRSTPWVALVDDHPVVRQGLATLIANEQDLHVCGSVGSAAEALDLVRAERPDLAIVDISLQDTSGLELIKRLKAVAPELKVLVSSMHDEALFADRALRAGALGYISKEEAIEEVVTAVRQVLAGKVYLSARMTERLLRSAASGVSPGAGEAPERALSDRELEVFTLIGEGLATREIARRLNLSVKTVETHREHIKKKLELADNNKLIRRAVEWVLRATGA
jgi:DNA-binding NarL/FixJ family response regulator